MKLFLTSIALVVAGASGAVASGLTTDGVYDSKWSPTPKAPVVLRCKTTVIPGLIFWYKDGACPGTGSVVIDTDGDGIPDTPVIEPETPIIDPENPGCVGEDCPPPPGCEGEDCPPPPGCEGEDCPPPPGCEGEDCPPPVVPPVKNPNAGCNNGFGNNSQCAPGQSLNNNNAENHGGSAANGTNDPNGMGSAPGKSGQDRGGSSAAPGQQGGKASDDDSGPRETGKPAKKDKKPKKNPN